jgi:FkbM family methyltransferase
LVANNQLNGFDTICRTEAVSNYRGKGVIYDLPTEHIYSVTLNSMRPDYSAQTKKVTVDTIAIADIVKEEGLSTVDLIKIDVESHEPEVIEGIGGYLDEFKPTILAEIWNDGVGTRVEALVRNKGYRFFVTDEITAFREVTEVRNPNPERGYVTYLFCQPTTAQNLQIG